MKKFKTSEAIRPMLEQILNKKEISFYFINDTELKADCSGMEFHRAVTRARCEIKNKKDNLPYDTTYYVKKIETEKSVREYNSEYIRFIEM